MEEGGRSLWERPPLLLDTGNAAGGRTLRAANENDPEGLGPE